jgi:uncharacterized protein YhaN
MATVASQTFQARIDGALERALAAWKQVPTLQKEWVEWDEESRFHFWVDWPIQEDLLSQLEEWDQAARMSNDQQHRYRRLLKVVARYRPPLERLFDCLGAAGHPSGAQGSSD